MTISSPLSAAFQHLANHKVLVRKHYLCCQSCGVASINEERTDENGFVFFHAQDTESALYTNHLYLSYDSFGDYPAMQIGLQIVDAFEKYGLRTCWNQNVSTRIKVHLDQSSMKELELLVDSFSSEGDDEF